MSDMAQDSVFFWSSQTESVWTRFNRFLFRESLSPSTTFLSLRNMIQPLQHFFHHFILTQTPFFFWKESNVSRSISNFIQFSTMGTHVAFIFPMGSWGPICQAKDPRVLSLAMQMKIDKFTKVKKATRDGILTICHQKWIKGKSPYENSYGEGLPGKRVGI